MEILKNKSVIVYGNGFGKSVSSVRGVAYTTAEKKGNKHTTNKQTNKL